MSEHEKESEREAIMCDLSFAHGMQLAQAMLAQGADAKVNQTIERLTLGALAALAKSKSPTG